MTKAPMTVGELQTLLSRAPANLPVQLTIGDHQEWLHNAAWDSVEKYAVLMGPEAPTAWDAAA